jgi:hypothetical protein
VQEPDEDPSCYKCGSRYQEEIDWFNLDAGDLKEDLKHAVEVTSAFHDKKLPEETPTEN